MKLGTRVWGLGIRLFLLVIMASFSLYLIPYTLYPIFAADSTPSATVKEKLDALKAEIASKAAKLKLEVNRKLQNKAYIGIVKSKSETSLTIASKTGTKMISVNQDTIYEDKTPVKKGGGKKVIPSLQNLKEESSIVALGDVDDTGVLHAKKVIILNPITYNLKPKTYLWGQIISESDDLITVKNKEDKNETVSTAEIKTKFKPDDFVIITGIKGNNDILEASFLYVIPKGATLRPKVSTPSVTPTTKPKLIPTTKPEPF